MKSFGEFYVNVDGAWKKTRDGLFPLEYICITPDQVSDNCEKLEKENSKLFKQSITYERTNNINKGGGKRKHGVHRKKARHRSK